MSKISLSRKTITTMFALSGLLAFSSGCHVLHHRDSLVLAAVPRELEKEPLAEYIIETPDVLLIEAVTLLPRVPYRIERLDTLFLKVDGALPDAPVTGVFVVDPEGVIRLGPQYGTVKVRGLTIDEAQQSVLDRLKEAVMNPQVQLELVQTHGLQLVTGEHLVRPDGTVALGRYGSVRVAGMTLSEARVAIESQLANFLEEPEVYVDVVEYNSKVCYVITDGAGLGEQVTRFPVTGTETVIDLIGQINGLPPVASKGCIWLARPTPAESGSDQVLPVDWIGITQRGRTATNYQILPGDRIYVSSDQLVAFNNQVEKIVAPLERMFGFTLLGHSTVRALQFGHRGFGQFGNNANNPPLP